MFIFPGKTLRSVGRTQHCNFLVKAAWLLEQNPDSISCMTLSQCWPSSFPKQKSARCWGQGEAWPPPLHVIPTGIQRSLVEVPRKGDHIVILVTFSWFLGFLKKKVPVAQVLNKYSKYQNNSRRHLTGERSYSEVGQAQITELLHNWVNSKPGIWVKSRVCFSALPKLYLSIFEA